MLIDPLPKSDLSFISREEGDFTILPFKSGQRDGFLQTLHQKPVVTGFLGRRIHDAYQGQYTNIYPINKFVAGKANELNSNDDPKIIKNIFANYKIKYIVIDKLLQDEDQLKKLDQYLSNLGITMHHSDHFVTVYRI